MLAAATTTGTWTALATALTSLAVVLTALVRAELADQRARSAAAGTPPPATAD